MSTLKFAEVYNLVVFLSKPTESEGFEQIVDFLNANPIQYALTVNPTIYILCIEQLWTTAKAKTINGEEQLQSLVDGNKILITKSTVRRDLQLEDTEGVDCLPNAAIFEQLTLMSTMAFAIICLATNQKFNFSKYIFESMVKNLDNVNKILMYPRAATTASSLEAEQDSGVNTPRSDEDSLKLKELMELCTNLLNKVLDLKTIKTTQAMEIESLKKRVKKLEKKQRPRTHKLKRLYKGRISAIDADEGITLVSTHDEQMFDADQDLGVTTAATTPTISINEVTLAQALAELKHTKPKAKAKGILFHEPKESTTTTTIIPKPKSQDKGKAKMIKEPIKLKKKDQIMLNEEGALKLQAEFEKEQRLANYQLAERLQAEEQQELNDEENDTLFMQLLEKKRKFFTTKRAEEKRNKPPTRAQQRSIMCTYLKNMEGWSLQNKSFANNQELFDKAMKRMNTFVDYRTELVVESLKEVEAKVTKGRIVRIKRLLDDLEVTDVKVRVTGAKQNIVLFNNQDKDLVLKRKKKISLDYNNSFLGGDECSSLAVDIEEIRDKKVEIGSLEIRSNNISDQEIRLNGRGLGRGRETGYRLWYSGSMTTRNKVGGIVVVGLKGKVMQVTKSSDRIMEISIVIYGETINVINAYTPQVGLSDAKTKSFRDALVMIKSLLDAIGITTAHVCVNTALMKLTLLRNFQKYSK
nr:hypothetical protein [Tanacetum cinerariifolium]